jgi:hypothetical protein
MIYLFGISCFFFSKIITKLKILIVKINNLVLYILIIKKIVYLI